MTLSEKGEHGFRQINTRQIAAGATAAALYVTLSLVTAPLCFGPVQFRIPEALCVLPGFTFAAVPGLTVGCFLANLLCGAPWPDVIFGSAATLLGAVGTYLMGRKVRSSRGSSVLQKLYWLPPVISNMLIIPPVLAYSYGNENWIVLTALTVGAGELLSVGVLGTLLQKSIEKRQLLRS